MSALTVRGPRVRAAQILAVWSGVLVLYPLSSALNEGARLWSPVRLAVMAIGLILCLAAIHQWRFGRSTFEIDTAGIRVGQGDLIPWSRIDWIWDSRLLTVPALVVVCRPRSGQGLVSTPARRLALRLGALPNGAFPLPVAKRSDHTYQQVIDAVRHASDGAWPVPVPDTDPAQH